MEVEYESNTKVTKNNEESDSDHYSEDEKELLITSYHDLNTFDSNDNRYLIFGTYGNATAYLKTALYLETKKNHLAIKGKFMEGKANDKKPKKLVAELYQIKHENEYSLLLVPKDKFNKQNYQTVTDFLFSGTLKINSILAFDSKFYKDVIFDGNKEIEIKDKLFSLKNSKQSQSNQFIKPKELPKFNGAVGFIAYLFVKSEILKLPLTVYFAFYSELEVCSSNLRIFDDCSFTYSFLKNKVDQDFIEANSIRIQDILKEFNSYKSCIYS